MDKRKKHCINDCSNTVIKEVKESEEHRYGYVEVCITCNRVLGYQSSPKKKSKSK